MSLGRVGAAGQLSGHGWESTVDLHRWLLMHPCDTDFMASLEASVLHSGALGCRPRNSDQSGSFLLDFGSEQKLK